MTPADLLSKWSALQWRQAHRLKAIYQLVELDDIHSAILLGWVRAISTYNPAIGSFSALAGKYGWNAGRKFCQVESKRGLCGSCGVNGVPIPTIDSLNAATDRHGDPVPLYATLALPEQEPVPDYPADWWERTTATLSPRLRKLVYMLYREEKPYRVIAKELGVTYQRVGQLKKVAIEKLRKARAA